MLITEAIDYSTLCAEFTKYAANAFDALREDLVKQELEDGDYTNMSAEFAYEIVNDNLSYEFELYNVIQNNIPLTLELLKTKLHGADLVLFNCFAQRMTVQQFVEKYHEYLNKVSAI